MPPHTVPATWADVPTGSTAMASSRGASPAPSGLARSSSLAALTGKPSEPGTPPLTPEANEDHVVPRAPLLNKADLTHSVIPTLRFDPTNNEPPRAAGLARFAGRRVVSTGDLAGLARRRATLEATAAAGAPTTLFATPERATPQSASPSQLSPSGSDASLFDATLLERWEDALSEGRFRYDVTGCPTKTLEGRFRFIMQLNLGRATNKRPTEFSADRVVQAFDGAKFNFTKAKQDELVFSFHPAMMRKSPSMADFASAHPAESAPNCVLINVSPIEYGHVLLVPRITECLPQRVTCDTLHLSLHMAAESANEHFRIGFNSLGAYATINHLHFQGYYMWQSFPVELAARQALFEAPGGVTVSHTLDYPVRLLVCTAHAPGSSLMALARVVAHMCERFEATNTPYNLLITESGRCVYVIPQRFSRAVAAGQVPADVQATGVNPAVFEIAGHMVLKRTEDYESMDEAAIVRMLACATLSAADFNAHVAAFAAELA